MPTELPLPRVFLSGLTSNKSVMVFQFRHRKREVSEEERAQDEISSSLDDKHTASPGRGLQFLRLLSITIPGACHIHSLVEAPNRHSYRGALPLPQAAALGGTIGNSWLHPTHLVSLSRALGASSQTPAPLAY